MKSYIILLIAILSIFYSCKNSSGNRDAHDNDEHDMHEVEGLVILTKQQQRTLDLQLGTFQMRNLTTTVKTNGQLKVPPTANAKVTTLMGGTVKNIKVFHGDLVSKGQVLATLEHPDYIEIQQSFAETAGRLEYLELEYNRQKELFENNVGAGKDFQLVKSEYNAEKAKYQGLRSKLLLLNLSPENVKKGIISNTVSIKAPIKGYVNKVNIMVGVYVDSKDELFDISDNSKIHADFMVYEKDVHLLKKGQRIDFTVSNLPDEELTATIFALGKSFESNTRAVHIHAKLNEIPENLIPGMYITGHIHTDENYTRALPNEAFVNEGTKSYIFIEDKSAIAKIHNSHIHNEEKEDHLENHSDKYDLNNNTNMQETAFRMVEVITGKQDDGYTEIKLLDSIPENTLIVMNAAYYLLADIKKGEAEHHH